MHSSNLLLTKALEVSQCPCSIISSVSRDSLTIGDVVLHSSSRINLEFLGINRSSQSTIESPGILSLGVTFGIVNVFGGKIAAESFGGDFKFGGSVSMGYHQFLHILCRKAEGTSLPRKPRIMTILRIVWRFVLDKPAVSTA
jgi:hypothetical protein